MVKYRIFEGMSQSNQGWLPLCHALQYNASSDIIKLIFQAYPQAVKVPNNSNGHLPLHIALWLGDRRRKLSYLAVDPIPTV
jgi:hypothetical protein